ncbi:hypothetical protein NP233_g12734 [Leucocoprinus birnbaumii]|uniref:Protein kinase domain-containing protein n=1 Tax=Leucocoprinus birnbaumii TaxID=56174 RepID=A0AAD5VF68_9AGAR|nr:hypothetical protein NP233_g12734 [Leucocoprinus birnbaumii]
MGRQGRRQPNGGSTSGILSRESFFAVSEATPTPFLTETPPSPSGRAYVTFSHRVFTTNSEFEARENADAMTKLASKGTPSALLDAKDRYDAPRCTQNTRMSFRRQIIEWGTSNEDQRCLLWLYGAAAVGKSTIAQTVAETFKGMGILGSVFFFSPSNDCSNIDLVIPTLALQLATLFPAYQSVLAQRLRGDPMILDKNRRIIFKELIVDPFKELMPSRPLIMLLDGLDHCNDRKAQSEFVEMITEYARESEGLPLRWIICSRLEHHLMNTFMKCGTICQHIQVDIEDEEAKQDVIQMLTSGFEEIRKRYQGDLEEDSSTYGDVLQVAQTEQHANLAQGSDMLGEVDEWPQKDQFRLIADKSSGFLMHAACILEFIADDKRDPQSQLQDCLRFLVNPLTWECPCPLSSLDLLYHQILSDLNPSLRGTALRILHMWAVAYNHSGLDITIKTILDDLQINRRTFFRSVQGLHSVMRIPSVSAKAELGEKLQAYHNSFRDFLLDPRRSGEFSVQGAVELSRVFPSETPEPSELPEHPPLDSETDAQRDQQAMSSHLDYDKAEIADNLRLTLESTGSSSTNNTAFFTAASTLNTVIDAKALMTERLQQLWSKLLREKSRREAVLRLRDDEAQSLIDFCDSALVEWTGITQWLRKHMTITLYELCRINNRYPQCFILDDIYLDTSEDGGGFSDVFKGHQGSTDEALCLKIIRLYQRSDVEAMLKAYVKEAIIWGQLRHPAILPLYGVFYMDREKKKVCLVSPWMKNGNLVRYLSDNPAAPRGPLIYDIAVGIQYLQSANLVHGDLKGLNVLVNDAGRACITDFGLSSLRTDSTLSRAFGASTIRGCSYRWASPELVDGKRPTMASDIWAFGCVCYEVLSGQYPFSECHADPEIILKLIRGTLPATKPLDLSQMEEALWNLILRCWAIEPQRRPTCQEIIRALDDIDGIKREPDGKTHDLLEHSRQRFIEASRKCLDIVDLVKTEQILLSVSKPAFNMTSEAR